MKAAASAEDVRPTFDQEVERLSPVYKVLSCHNVELLGKLQCIGKDYMLRAARESCRVAGSRPVMMIYSSDCTPMLHKKRTVVKVGNKKEVRESTEPCEWLLHRAYWLWRDDLNNLRTKTAFEAPILMKSKKTWHLYAAATRFAPLLRDWHHNEGISVSWYVFDRAQRTSLCRLLRRRHLKSYEALAAPRQYVWAELLDWVLDSACGDHDVQNGLMHGCSTGHEGDTAMMFKNIFKAVRSARDTLTKLLCSMSAWLNEYMEIEADAFEEAVVEQCWLACGAKPHLATELARINLRWQGASLLVHNRVLEFPDPLGHVASLVLATYTLRTFTTSRFLSLGRSCQGLAMSLMVGLDSHMAFTRASPETKGEWYTHCYDLLNPEARLFICKTALAAQATDELHALLLKDDRIALQPEMYEEAVQSKLRMLNDEVPALLLSRLASHIPGCTAVRLESDTLRAAYEAFGYIDRMVFQVAKKQVYRLCSGDIAANLQALVAPGAAAATEPTVKKIQGLLRLGYSSVCIEQALRLIQQAPWSTLRVEQMHGTAAKQHHVHKGFTPAVHAVKTAVNTMLPMVRKARPPERMSMDQVRLRGLKRKRPMRAGGSGAFLSVVSRDAQAALPADAGAHVRLGAARSVVRTHHTEFKNMPQQLQDRFHQKAHANRQRNCIETTQAIGELQAKIDADKHAAAAKELAASPLRASCFGWDDEDLRALTSMLHGTEYPAKTVEKERLEELLCPPKPALATRQDLADADFGQMDDDPERNMPQWVAQVCRHRVHFMNVVLVYGDDDRGHCFSMVHASKKPFWSAFLRLVRGRAEGAPASSAEPLLRLPREAHRHHWGVLHSSVFSEDAALLAAAPSHIIPGLHYEMKTVAWSDGEKVPFDTFMEGLPPPPKEKKDKKRKRDDEDDDTLLAKHPWMRRFSKFGRAFLGRPDKPASGATPVEMDEEELALVYEAVAEAREELAAEREGEDDEPYFVVEPRGGAWTKGKTGMSIDSYRARPGTGVPERWMKEFFSHGARSCTVTAKFGTSVAVGLCKVWCELMRTWFEAWLAAGSVNHCEFQAADVLSCTPDSLREELEALPVGHAARQRWWAFRGLLPVFQG